MARYECDEDGASKFWEVELSGLELTTRWGKIGTAGQSKTKPFTSEAAALKEHDKLVAEKTGKGYKRVDGGAESAAPVVKAPDLASPPVGKAPKPGKATATKSGADAPFAAIVESYRAFAKKLKKAGFEVEATFGAPASDEAIAAAEAARGRPFPLALKQLLKVADGFEIEADLDNDSAIRHHVLSTQQHIGRKDYRGSLWFDGADDDHPARNFLMIDEPQDELAYGYVLLGEVGDDPQIHYHYVHETMTPKGLTLAAYLDDALVKDRVKLKEAIEERDEAPAPAVDRNNPFAILRSNFASIDYQNTRVDGTIGFSNVCFHPPGTASIGARALLVMAFEHISFEATPVDADLAPLAEMSTLVELSLKFAAASDAAIPLALSGLATGTFKTVKRLSVELAYLDSLAFLGAFAGLEEVTIVVQGGSIPSDLSGTEGLRKLTIRGSSGGTVAVPATLVLPSSLRKLALRNLGLRAPPVFHDGAHLTDLDLGSNRLEHLTNMEGLPSLVTLNLHDNQLTSFEGLGAQTQLVLLAAGSNLLNHLDGISHLARLESLQLPENTIATLSALPFPALTRLGLRDNLLADLPSFAGNPTLADLDVRSNKLGNHHAWLDTLPKACRVNLESNGIATALKTGLRAQYAAGPTLSV